MSTEDHNPMTPLERLIVAAWKRGDLEEHKRLTALDARVAKRRAEDARKAGRALDRLLEDRCDGLGCTCCGQLNDLQELVRRSGLEAHHNRHYGVSLPERCLGHVPHGGLAGINYIDVDPDRCPECGAEEAARYRLFGADAHGGRPDGIGSQSIGACDWPAMPCTGHDAERPRAAWARGDGQ